MSKKISFTILDLFDQVDKMEGVIGVLAALTSALDADHRVLKYFRSHIEMIIMHLDYNRSGQDPQILVFAKHLSTRGGVNIFGLLGINPYNYLQDINRKAMTPDAQVDFDEYLARYVLQNPAAPEFEEYGGWAVDILPDSIETFAVLISSREIQNRQAFLRPPLFIASIEERITRMAPILAASQDQQPIWAYITGIVSIPDVWTAKKIEIVASGSTAIHLAFLSLAHNRNSGAVGSWAAERLVAVQNEQDPGASYPGSLVPRPNPPTDG